jgi:hypothetical protein
LSEDNLEKKDKIYQANFSYLGNQNNPPDFILKGGDAIEVKKIEGFNSRLALNSSPPKDKLRSADERITDECKRCDGGNWQEKDLFYVIGSAKGGKVKYLFFIHGSCYAADHKIYERIHAPIKRGVGSMLDSLGLERANTIELGKVKRADPLGITELRVRGMWSITNPVDVFSNLVPLSAKDLFSVNVIMLKEKYSSYTEKDRKRIEKLSGRLIVKDIEIKSPNNPARLLGAKLLSYK